MAALPTGATGKNDLHVQEGEEVYVPGLEDLGKLLLGIWRSVLSSLQLHALSS